MKKIISFLIIAAVLSAVLLGAIPCSAKTTYTKTISLLSVRANVEGEGYKWNNYDDILTLDGLNIDTEDDYGLKIMDGATVILKGKNYIKASKAAIFIQGKVIFKGNGTLTLVSDNGIYCSSDDSTDTLAINGGNYNITSTSAGIVSDFHTVTFNSCNIKVETKGDTAVKAYRLTVGANTVLNANASLEGAERLHIEGATITVNSTSEALKGASVTLTKLNLKAGNDDNSLTTSDTYSGQACVKTSSTYDDSPKSILLGDKYGAYFDVLIFIGMIAVLSLIVILPIVIKKKKAQAAIIARDKAEEERKAELKAKKKAGKQEAQQ